MPPASHKHTYLTLNLAKGVYAQSPDAVWERYKRQLDELHAASDREVDRQRNAWAAYQALLAQGRAAVLRSMDGLGKSAAVAMQSTAPAHGPGSRGGHVLRTLPSGRVVYSSGDARYAAMHASTPGSIKDDAEHVDRKFQHYSPMDHAHAASAHFHEAYSVDHAAGGKQTPEGRRHMRAALAHNRLAAGAVAKSESKTGVWERAQTQAQKQGKGQNHAYIAKIARCMAKGLRHEVTLSKASRPTCDCCGAEI